MSMATRQFVETARNVRVVSRRGRVTSDGQSTIMRVCGRCGMAMPHKIRAADVCILCEMEEGDDGEVSVLGPA